MHLLKGLLHIHTSCMKYLDFSSALRLIYLLYISKFNLKQALSES